LGKVKCTSERFSWYSSNDLRAKIEPPSCRQYKPGNFLAVRRLNWDEIINKDDGDEHWADPGVLSSGRSCAGDGNDNDNGEGEEDMRGGVKGTRKRQGTTDGNRNGRGKEKGNSKGNGIVKRSPGGDDNSCAIALQLQMQMSEANFNMEGQLERAYSEAEASPAMSITSKDDTDSTKSDTHFDSSHEPDGDLHIKNDVDAPEGVDVDGDVHMQRDGDNEEAEDKEGEEEDKVKENEEEKEDEDEDEDDSKEPRTIRQGEMVNTSADDVDTIVDNQPIVRPEQGQEMRDDTLRPQPPVHAPQPHSLEPCSRPRTPETHPLNGLEHSDLQTPPKPRPAEPSLIEANAAGTTSDVDVDQQVQGESACGDSLPDVPLPGIPLPDVALPEMGSDGPSGEE
jgi:hypothetical protein